MKPLILASASPRRKALLQQIGLSFSTVPASINEDICLSNQPQQLVQDLALRKARYVAADLEQGLVIGADTVVVQDQSIFGKPEDRQDAYVMLSKLNGRDHEVMTGLALVNAETGEKQLAVEITRVYFRLLSSDELYAYIDSGEPFDKAGAYGIQGLGSVLVERIEGCYYNVVGLPLTRLAQMLLNWDIFILGG
ncbi:MAG TPA: septum formation inhibitor Maf [Syntrophomonadaceae bacterium]|nr:septum formation inhibitor Maf [Syntrophomonadaceae bacterium]